MEHRKETLASLTEDQRQKGIAQVNEVLLAVRDVMTKAIQRANEGKITPEEFWKRLFINVTPFGKSIPPIKEERRSKQYHSENLRLASDSSALCPSNPYDRLDIQDCSKYLRYGGQRGLSSNEFAEDSLNFCSYFGLPIRSYQWADQKNAPKWKGPGAPYADVLNRMISQRNLIAHLRKEEENQLTIQQFDGTITLLEQMVAPIVEHGDFRDERKAGCATYWDGVRKKFNLLLGAPPVSLEELAQELFYVECEEELTGRQKGALIQAVYESGFAQRDHLIFSGLTREELLHKLRKSEAIQEILGKAPVEAVLPEVDQTISETQTKEQELWPELTGVCAARFREAGTLMNLDDSIVWGLLDSFLIWTHESMFLCAEGRKVLKRIGEILTVRNQKLTVDQSVVHAIFRSFRNSSNKMQGEEESIGEQEQQWLEKQREEQHRQSKQGIKLLRYLQEHHCLEIAFSPTSSRYTQENFIVLAQRYSNVRMLVFTTSRVVADGLGKICGKNVVLAKPDLDGRLIFFRSTMENWKQMLAQAGNLDGGKRKTENSQQHATPPQGETMVAVDAQGNKSDVKRKAFINDGGEGSIFQIDLFNQVAKIYFPNMRTQERRKKLEYMVANNPNISGLCWPTSLLFDEDGNWIGFLMPRARGKELATTVFCPGRGGRNIAEQGWDRRSLALIAANIAEVFTQMHRKNILMGDVNPRNFLVAADCSVHLVDCDSYQVEGFSCPVGTPLYTPPEVHVRMRQQGTIDYGFERTVNHELYSLGVLLFEILMLGKAPYESRYANINDVVDAIITGNFAYPYRSGEEDAPKGRSNISPPVGLWRNIWSHMPRMAVKTPFYNLFTGGERPSSEKWARNMREYARLIEEGKSTNELTPSTFKVVYTEGSDEEMTKMVDLVCPSCGSHFNMGEDVYLRQKSKNTPILCNVCRDQQKNFANRKRWVACKACGRQYQDTVANWIAWERAKRPLYCPNCAEQWVQCAKCGEWYRESRIKLDQLEMQGKDPLCQDCFQKQYVSVTCEICDNPFRIARTRLQRLEREGSKIICHDCQKRENRL